MTQYILSIDQGTTSSRALLFDAKGGHVATSQREFKQYFPNDGWVEHDPEDIWSTTLEVCRKVVAQKPGSLHKIIGLGITNQRETTIVWDRNTGEPIYRAIVWQDRRTADFCLALKERGAEKIVAENPYKTPMMIYPAVHYTMGGIWCDYNLMTTIPGCYAAGEANFSDHGANRLGASALMQGLADGYFVLPYTIGDYLADDIRTGTISTDLPEFNEAAKEVTDRLEKLINIKGTKSVDSFHKRLGEVMWNKVGMARNAKGLTEAMDEIKAIREDFWKDVRIPGGMNELNPELEKAGRVADFLELGELFAKDALAREESCGGHFREESVEEDGLQKGEAKRNDKDFAYVAAWEHKGEPRDAVMHKEELEFNDIELKQRSYK